MNKQEEPTLHAPLDEVRETGVEATRTEEQGDAAEPDAPTRVRENVGMNTILEPGLGTGVQLDETDV